MLLQSAFPRRMRALGFFIEVLPTIIVKQRSFVFFFFPIFFCFLVLLCFSVVLFWMKKQAAEVMK